MPRIAYIHKRFSAATLEAIERANAICEEYAAQGFTLTLRQLYYQHVARGYIPNRDSEYKRLGGIVNDARLAGLMDWNHLEDRTRNLRDLSHWDSPKQILEAVANQYRVDKWAGQEYRPVVFIEKDALVGVIEGVCQDNDVPFFSCRGYTSQSEIWSAAMRMVKQLERNQTPVVLHLGDHDPSGIDMTRDITDRLAMFVSHHLGVDVEVRRLALNMDQVEQYNPPPNPAKGTDSRFLGYAEVYGEESWELDALDPPVIADLIQEAVNSLRDDAAWDDSVEEEDTEKTRLGLVARNWSAVKDYAEENFL